MNEDELKNGSQNNGQLPVKSISEIPRPKAAPRKLKPVDARNGYVTVENGSKDSLEESRLPVVDVEKMMDDMNKVKVNNIHNNDDVANHKMPISQTNGFSPNISNGATVGAMIVEDESEITLSQEKKKKKKKKEEKGKIKTKEKEKKRRLKNLLK